MQRFHRFPTLTQTGRLLLLLAAVLLFMPPLPAFATQAPTAIANNEVPVETGAEWLSNINAIDAGDDHTCAVTAAGGVKCWGNNEYGQLGDGTTTNRNTPVFVAGLATGVTAVSAGGGITGSHTCAVTDAGGVKCWGNNEDGQLGDGSTISSTLPVDVVGLAAGVTAVSAGTDHTCALTDAGGVKCWGSNFLGQLGHGSADDNSLTPVDVSGLTSGVAMVSAGLFHTCALTTDGGVKCWGSNSDGQLGRSGSVSVTPVDVTGLASGVQAIAARGLNTCALTDAGGVKCWGNNADGQLGNGTSGNENNSATPVDVVDLASGIAAIGVGGSHACALSDAGSVKCWGRNVKGQLGDGTTVQQSTPVAVTNLAGNVAAVGLGGSHTCALTAGGDMKCWGENNVGQLGDGTTTDRSEPVDVNPGSSQPTPLPIDSEGIDAGSWHACAVSSAGGVQCWGRNTSGQLGDGTTMTRTSPVEVIGLNADITAVSAGGTHTCALTAAGGVKCWGSNGFGWLGDSTKERRTTPVDVVGLNSGVVAVSAGSSHTCALTNAGGVKCWGAKGFGQLGIDESSLTPVDVPGLTAGVAAITTGNTHTCAVLDTGGVKCWGGNTYGQLGDGSTTNSSVPVDVVGLTSKAVAVSAGQLHTCAVMETGGVKCWGRNGLGQLGNGSAGAGADSPTPVDVDGLTNAVAVSVGDSHSCALTSDGNVLCWGLGADGQLGNGATGTRTTPVEVEDLALGMAVVSAGGDFACALSTRGTVNCWGDNEYGQLGDGTTDNSSTPVSVSLAVPEPFVPTQTLFLPNIVQ